MDKSNGTQTMTPDKQNVEEEPTTKLVRSLSIGEKKKSSMTVDLKNVDYQPSPYDRKGGKYLKKKRDKKTESRKSHYERHKSAGVSHRKGFVKKKKNNLSII